MTTQSDEGTAVLTALLADVQAARENLRTANVNLVEAVREARDLGMTLQAIGDVLGVTKQRVGQMLDAERKP